MSATKDTYMHAYEEKLNKHLQDEWQQATWPSSKFPACTNASSHLQSKVVSNALPHPPGYCWSLGWKMTIMKVLSCCAQQWQAIAASTRSHLEGLELKLIETWFLFHPTDHAWKDSYADSSLASMVLPAKSFHRRATRTSRTWMLNCTLELKRWRPLSLPWFARLNCIRFQSTLKWYAPPIWT